MQQHLDITNIGTWIMDDKETVYRVYTKKWTYTPFEQDKKYSDESEYYDDGYPIICRITNAIEVPNDVLLELTELNGEEEGNNDIGRKVYRLLSEIHIVCYDCDNRLSNSEEEE